MTVYRMPEAESIASSAAASVSALPETVRRRRETPAAFAAAICGPSLSCWALRIIQTS